MFRAGTLARQSLYTSLFMGGSSESGDSLGPEREIAKNRGISVGLGLDDLHQMKTAVEGLYDESAWFTCDAESTCKCKMSLPCLSELMRKKLVLARNELQHRKSAELAREAHLETQSHHLRLPSIQQSSISSTDSSSRQPIALPPRQRSMSQMERPPELDPHGHSVGMRKSIFGRVSQDKHLHSAFRDDFSIKSIEARVNSGHHLAGSGRSLTGKRRTADSFF
jgi:hypothetical protein